MIESLTIRPGMLVVCLSMGWDEERWMLEVAGGFCAIGRMTPACASFTPHFCRVQSPVYSRAHKPLSTAPTHQTHCSSRRHGVRNCFVHLFSKVSHDETRKNMKDRRVRGFGVSAKFVTWALKYENVALRPPSRTFWWKTKPKEETRKEDGTVGSPVIPKRTPG